jgi:DNA-binding CsgD family transcriptional regulator
MALRHRPMRAADVRECVEIVAAHPLLGPQYGSVIKDLPSVWLGLLRRESFRAVVFEDTKDSQVRTVGVGTSVFVSDDFVRALKTPPFFWVGPELTKRFLCGDSPLLSDKHVRQENASEGLNLVVWEGCFLSAYSNCIEAHTKMFAAFAEQHRGFLLKELVGQPVSLDVLEGTIRSGGSLLDATDGRYVESPDRPLNEVIKRPFVVGVTQELAAARMGTWMASLFVYQPPQFGFRPSEQRLLLAALQGGTDESLAKTLGISLSAVKKTWRLIYERVTAKSPGLIPDQVPEELTSERGKEKKQLLPAYMREHPEELRPATL